MNNDTMIHAFESAGLGRAPFRLADIENTAAGGSMRRLGTDASGVEFWTTPGGTCAYCGKDIIVLCTVVDADGKRFHVGTSCVAKTGDAGLKKVVRKFQTEQRKTRERARIDAACVATMYRIDLRAALASNPHPIAWRAEQGDTELDWAEWMFNCAGNAGRMRVVRVVEKALKELV